MGMHAEANDSKMAEPTLDATQWPALLRARRAIVVVDVVESVRLMQAHEADVVDRWRRFINEVRAQTLPAHGGRLVKSLGDGLMLEFESVVSAARAALDMQRLIETVNDGRAPQDRLWLRVGAHVSDVIIDRDDLFGSGVNLAARLTTLAGPGEIVVSAAMRDGLADGLDADVEDLGDCWLKHIDQPVRAFRIGPAGPGPVTAAPPPMPLRPTVAVIPFEMLAGDTAQAMIGEALADDIIAALSQSAALNVISRLSTTVFGGRPFEPAAIGARLGAQYLLRGSVRLSGERVMVLAELSEAAAGHVLWAERLPGDLRGLWAADDALIATIVAEVGAAVMQRELERASTHAMPNLNSYSLLLGSIALMHRSSATEFDTARRMLEHLIDRDRRHARPHAWLANWYALRVTQSRSDAPQADTRRAFDLAQCALERDPSSALALAIDGVLQLNLRKDVASARTRLDAALQANPNESLAWLFKGILHAFAAEGDEAEAASARALSLSPVDPMRHYYDSLAATAALGARRYRRAIDLAERSLRANRLHPSTYRALAIAQAMDGQLDKARDSVRALLGVTPGYTVGQFRTLSGFSTGPLGATFADALAAAGLPP